MRGGNTRLVLIVEAEMATRIALRHLFAGQGWHVAEARTGGEATALLTLYPDWVIINPCLPTADAVDFVRNVRKKSPEVRVALIPEELDQDTLPWLLDLAPDLLMRKPLAFDRLLELCAGSRRPSILPGPAAGRGPRARRDTAGCLERPTRSPRPVSGVEPASTS